MSEFGGKAMIGLSDAGVEGLRAETIVAAVAKNAREEIRISVNGHGGVTVRVWKNVADGYLPTKSGFNLSADRLEQFIAGLVKAERACEART